MIRTRGKDCKIKIRSEKELFCSFDIYWRYSKDDLLHRDGRCIDVMVQEIMNKFINTSTLGRSYLDDTPRTLESFHGFLKDNGIQWNPNYRIYYRDDENDDIPIDSDLEYKEALKFLLSRNMKTRENVMLIIEGDIKKTNHKLENIETSIQLEKFMSNASAIDSVTNDSREFSKLEKETAPLFEMNSTDDTKNVTSDSLKNEESLDMLRTYLENFKKEIVNDVVKIMEQKLLSAFGNVENGNGNLNQESPIHKTLHQENSQYEEIDPRFCRMRDEMQRHNRPIIDTGNIPPRSFSGQFPRTPMFPPHKIHYRHPNKQKSQSSGLMEIVDQLFYNMGAFGK